MRIPRLLRNRAVVLAIGALLAVAVAAYEIGKPPAVPLGANAEASVLLDTGDSQLVNAGSAQVGTLPLRASLVGDLMASNQMKARIARQDGLAPNELGVLGPSSGAAPAFLTPLVTKVTPFAAGTSAPYIVALYTDLAAAPTNPTPLITVTTQAPNAAQAASLAGAAITVLRSVFRGTGGGQDGGFVVRSVAAPHTIVLPHKSRRVVYGIGGAIFLFVFWFVGTSVAAGIAGRVRRPQLA